MSNPWPNCRRLSPGAAAVLGALHLSEPDEGALARLSDSGWRDALDYCDRAGLTLLLRDAAHGRLPGWVAERLEQDATKNLLRLHTIRETYRNLSAWLGAAGIDFVALKGITHCGLSGTPPESRVQYDIDLWIPGENVHRAQAELIARAYQPIDGIDNTHTGHLPGLARKTGWAWRGDFFDPEIPLPVELHFSLWSEEMERLPAPGSENFWRRRTRVPIAGVELDVLSPLDAAAYAALHLLKHVLRGSAKVFHGFELARLLDPHAEESDPLWTNWNTQHSPELRRLEAVVFRLAQEWFGGHVPPAVAEEIARLPDSVKSWFPEFATSPAVAPFHPNKDELWLHLSLLESRRDAFSILRRRLLPLRIPAYTETAFMPEGNITLRRRVHQWMSRSAYAAGRARHHAFALPRTAWTGVRFWWRINPLGEQFWIFLGAAVVFNFALFVFALLYNLFLMDLGYREDFLGVVNSAQRAGSVVGTLPAAWLAYRFGLRRTLLASFAGIGITEALRAAIGARLPVAALAFASGCLFATWAVILAPSIAAAVEEKQRPSAFSIFFAVMFATGIAGNWIGGRLPDLLHGKQMVLFASAILSGLALLPAWRLKPSPMAKPGERVYPRSSFLVRYLVPFALWHLATGAFNPFNNVYFARLGFKVERIGSVFSVAQAAQVVVVLFAPWVIRRLGLLSAIVWMMAATALGLSGLAAQPASGMAVLAYISYMSFQWMSEPGLNTLLMNHVEERERSGASALNFLAAFGAQMVAAFSAGALLSQFGYGAVLAGASVLALIAAVLFRMLLSD